MNNCNKKPCEKVDPCFNPCINKNPIIKQLVDECSGRPIHYITSAYAVLMEDEDCLETTIKLLKARIKALEEMSGGGCDLEDIETKIAQLRANMLALEVRLTALENKNLGAVKINGETKEFVDGVCDLGGTYLKGDASILTELTNKVNALEGAEPNVQSNWAETDTNNDAFIKNKPDLSIYELKNKQVYVWNVTKKDISDKTDTVDTTLITALQINDVGNSSTTKSEVDGYNGTWGSINYLINKWVFLNWNAVSSKDKDLSYISTSDKAPQITINETLYQPIKFTQHIYDRLINAKLYRSWPDEKTIDVGDLNDAINEKVTIPNKNIVTIQQVAGSYTSSSSLADIYFLCSNGTTSTFWVNLKYFIPVVEYSYTESMQIVGTAISGTGPIRLIWNTSGISVIEGSDILVPEDPNNSNTEDPNASEPAVDYTEGSEETGGN